MAPLLIVVYIHDIGATNKVSLGLKTRQTFVLGALAYFPVRLVGQKRAASRVSDT